MTVLDMGADPTGRFDAAPAFNAAASMCRARGFAAWWVLLATGQVYLLKASVVITPNVAVMGDRGPARLAFSGSAAPKGGYMTASPGLPAIFSYTGSSDPDQYGQLHMEGLAFYSAVLNSTPCVWIGQQDNAPHRPMTFRDLSATGWACVLLFDSGKADLAAANVSLVDCHFNRNGLVVDARTRVLGFRMENCTSEGGGGRIAGRLDDAILISGCMLELVDDLIDVQGSVSPLMRFTGNYLEANGGDYVIRFDCGSVLGELVIGENSGWHICTAKDLVLLKGVGRIRLEQFSTAFLSDSQAHSNNLPGRRELVTLQGCNYLADLNGQGVMAYANTTNSLLLPPDRYVDGAGEAQVPVNLGNTALDTPWGRTVAGFRSRMHTSVGPITSVRAQKLDVLVVSLLCRIASDVDGVRAEPMLSLMTPQGDVLARVRTAYDSSLDGLWRLLICTIPLSAPLKDGFQLAIGPLGQGASSGLAVEVAALSYEVIAKESLDSAGRFHLKPRLPLRGFRL